MEVISVFSLGAILINNLLLGIAWDIILITEIPECFQVRFHNFFHFRLKELNLAWTNLSKATILHVIKNLPKLQQLNLSGCRDTLTDDCKSNHGLIYH